MPELSLDLGFLQRARRPAIQARRDGVVAAAALEVSAREPGRAAMARRARPCRRGLRACDPLFRVLEPALVRERASKHELRCPYLLDVVGTPVQQVERLARLRLRKLGLAEV